MSYVDGYVAAVPKANREAFVRFCGTAAEVFKSHGALEVVDTWGDDVPDGKLTSFPMAVNCGADEVVSFGYIVWPSKEARDAGMQAAMADERMGGDMAEMPFDGQRMIFGGFRTI